MPIIEWNESFKLGIGQFDDHHRHLVSIINRLYDNFTSGAPAESVEAVLDELIDYATYHFAAEEYWMKENLYPRLAEHSSEHDRFSARVAEMQKDYSANKKHLSLEVLTFLKNWLTHHILQSDADYKRFAPPPSGITIRLD